MTASAAGELIDKYGADIVAKGLNKLGIDGDRIKKLTGIDLSVTGMCFTGDTLIVTQEGHKQISEIEIGDVVYSENVETGEIGLKPVKNVFVREVKTLLHISVDSYECEAIIKTTMVHPFYVVNVGWVEDQDLVVGDLLKLVTGEEVVVSDIQSEELETPVKVYNFEVADWHTYYVSELGVLVHNKGSNSCDELVEGAVKLSDEAIDFSVSIHKRLQHAYKHASDLGFGNWNKQNAALWKDYITDTLKNATKTFDNKLGNDAVQGFYRVVDGNDVAVYIYKEGVNKGLVASVVKLSENQLVKFGLK